MNFKAAALAALALVAFAGDVQAGTDYLLDPEPVAVPANLTEKQVAKEIKRALLGRGWKVSGEQPGQIDSTLFLREHVAKIKITYDLSQVRIAYVDSTNLDYKLKRGRPVIHSNYLGWIGFLAGDITANLGVTALDQE